MNRMRELIERDQWAELRTDAQRITDLSKNSDMEVLAFTFSEAVKKASEIYSVSPRFFTCKEITKGHSGMMGWFRSPSRFLITLKPEAKEMLSTQTDYNTGNELAQNKNGSFRLVMRKAGLQLTINAQTGLGAPVSFAQIERELARMGVTDYDKALLHRAMKNSGEKVIIAPYIRSENDSTFTVYTDKGNMSAYFSFTQPQTSSPMSAAMVLEKHGVIGRIPEVQEVLEALKKIGVVYGINEATIQEVLDNELHDIPIVVAEGTPVENGKNGYIEYAFPTGQEQFKHAVMPDGSVNFKELNIIHNVQKDDILAIMHPPTLGVIGHNLLGETIQPTPGKEISWNIGENIALSRDGLQAIAANMGQVYLKNNQICVDTALEIGTDLNLTVGNIDFIGNVIIKGNVDDGFTVVSGGNIEIHGHIGKSFIHAEGDIIAHKGIQGKDDAKIECGGNLYAKFIERSSLTVGSNIVVTDYILHSTISCTGNVIVSGGKRSIIAGGNMRVEGSVFAVQTGAESYIETNIEVGYPFKALREMNALERFIKEKTEQIELMKTELSGLAGNIPAARTVKLEQKIFFLQDQQDRAVQSISRLHADIKEVQDAAFLSVSKRIMPGVKLRIGDTILDNGNEQSGGSYSRKEKNIVSGPYKPPQNLTPPSLKEDNKRR